MNKSTAATCAVEQDLLWMSSCSVILHPTCSSFQEALGISAMHVLPHIMQSNGLHASWRLWMCFSPGEGPPLLPRSMSIHVEGSVSTLGTQPIFPWETENVPVSSTHLNPECFPFTFMEEPSHPPRRGSRDDEPSQTPWTPRTHVMTSTKERTNTACARPKTFRMEDDATCAWAVVT